MLHFNLLANHNKLEIHNPYTLIDMSSLRRECENLDELLISACDIEFDEVLGEGILSLIFLCILTTTCNAYKLWL